MLTYADIIFSVHQDRHASHVQDLLGNEAFACFRVSVTLLNH